MVNFWRPHKVDKAADQKGDSSSAVSSSLPADTSLAELAPKEKPEKPEKKKKKEHGATEMPAVTSQMSGSGMGAPSGGRNISVNDFISKTKTQQRQGLKPSGPELVAYARYLGIDPVADHDLLWIATEALEAPLPSEWTEHFDSNDRVFYYNATMRVSSWTHPLEHKYRETYKDIVAFRNSNMSSQERRERLEEIQRDVKQMEHDVHKDIAQWTEHADEQGNRFYFSREERQSTWTDPRPAKCQVLGLRMKMLKLLQQSSGMSNLLSEPMAEDPAVKRAKVGKASKDPWRGAPGGTVTTPWSDKEDVGQAREKAASPRLADSSDSDEDGARKKKKKKHKKHKKLMHGGDAVQPAPLGQRLHESRSEPSNVGKATGMEVDDKGWREKGALSQAAAKNLLDPVGEGLSSTGRAKVKPGIRLQPLGGGTMPSLGPPGGLPGVSSSASVPALRSM